MGGANAGLEWSLEVISPRFTDEIGEPGIENMGCFSKEVLLMDTKNPALFSEEAFKVEGEIDFF